VTGKFIGQTDKVTEAPNSSFRPAAGVSTSEWKRQNSAKLSATLSAISGKHDIYFVFKNSKAKAEEVLASVHEIQFKN
jgi:cytochrome c